MAARASKPCPFCAIARGEAEAEIVLEDETVVAFLDHRPLLAGHCLLVPRRHVETLPDLPPDLLAPVFHEVQILARAVEWGMAADGSFVAVNTRISQSVPHLHVHVVPRWKGDGLFSPGRMIWKRSPYRDDGERREAREKIRQAVEEIRRLR
ncbi:MAG TPA: HIT family protein [Thermoanaerobaculia bacterium]|nr:HIT family protein [Thermoanaerobaculia bacterium]